MVSALTAGLPTVAPVGVPRVTVSVWATPGSDNSVPVMVAEVWPAGITSGLAVTLLKSVPLTAVPPRLKGIVVSTLEAADSVTVTLKVPALALTLWLAVASCTVGRVVKVLTGV